MNSSLELRPSARSWLLSAGCRPKGSSVPGRAQAMGRISLEDLREAKENLIKFRPISKPLSPQRLEDETISRSKPEMLKPRPRPKIL